MSIHVTKLAVAALAITSAFGSAQAAVGSPAVTAPRATAEPAPKAAEKQYCVRTTFTGTRVPKKLCRTREAWLAQGFDPLAPNN